MAESLEYEIRYIVGYPKNIYEGGRRAIYSIYCDKKSLWRNSQLLEQFEGCLRYCIFQNEIAQSPLTFETYDHTRKKFVEFNIEDMAEQR